MYLVERGADVGRNVTYPKNGDRRLRETIKDLKAMVNQLKKRNRVLEQEIGNIMKPVRPRREHIEQPSPKMMTQEEWRQDFIKRHKPGIDKRLEELDNENPKDDEKDQS